MAGGSLTGPPELRGGRYSSSQVLAKSGEMQDCVDLVIFQKSCNLVRQDRKIIQGDGSRWEKEETEEVTHAPRHEVPPSAAEPPSEGTSGRRAGVHACRTADGPGRSDRQPPSDPVSSATPAARTLGFPTRFRFFPISGNSLSFESCFVSAATLTPNGHPPWSLRPEEPPPGSLPSGARDQCVHLPHRRFLVFLGPLNPFLLT